MVLSWDKIVTLKRLGQREGEYLFQRENFLSATVKAGNSGVYVPDMPRAALVPGLMSSLNWVKLWQEPIYNELTVGRTYKSSWETSAWHRSCFCSGDILIQVCLCITTAKIDWTPYLASIDKYEEVCFELLHKVSFICMVHYNRVIQCFVTLSVK